MLGVKFIPEFIIFVTSRAVVMLAPSPPLPHPFTHSLSLSLSLSLTRTRSFTLTLMLTWLHNIEYTLYTCIPTYACACMLANTHTHIYIYTALVKIMLTLIYSLQNVCPCFKWYCCSLVFVCWIWRQTDWDRPVNHLAHIMYVLWINGFFNLSFNIILTNLYMPIHIWTWTYNNWSSFRKFPELIYCTEISNLTSLYSHTTVPSK
jgi:hypothetical protein